MNDTPADGEWEKVSIRRQGGYIGLRVGARVPMATMQPSHRIILSTICENVLQSTTFEDISFYLGAIVLHKGRCAARNPMISRSSRVSQGP